MTGGLRTLDKGFKYPRQGFEYPQLFCSLKFRDPLVGLSSHLILFFLTEDLSQLSLRLKRLGILELQLFLSSVLLGMAGRRPVKMCDVRDV